MSDEPDEVTQEVARRTLPPGIEPDDEIAVTWEQGDQGVVISARLGDVSIQVAASYDDADRVPWLVAALPNILEQAWDAIEANNTEGTP